LLLLLPPLPPPLTPPLTPPLMTMIFRHWPMVCRVCRGRCCTHARNLRAAITQGPCLCDFVVSTVLRHL
jgi:hypothetical protein